jgi:hypothetical protein
VEPGDRPACETYWQELVPNFSCELQGLYQVKGGHWLRRVPWHISRGLLAISGETLRGC